MDLLLFVQNSIQEIAIRRKAEEEFLSSRLATLFEKLSDEAIRLTKERDAFQNLVVESRSSHDIISSDDLIVFSCGSVLPNNASSDANSDSLGTLELRIEEKKNSANDDVVNVGSNGMLMQEIKEPKETKEEEEENKFAVSNEKKNSANNICNTDMLLQETKEPKETKEEENKFEVSNDCDDQSSSFSSCSCSSSSSSSSSSFFFSSSSSLVQGNQCVFSRNFVQVDQPTKDVIELNVRGQFFTTTRAILTSRTDSMLSAMFNGLHTLDFDSYGRVLIDRNPFLFQIILNHLSTNEINFVLPSFLCKEEDRRSLRMELDYFCLYKQGISFAKCINGNPSVTSTNRSQKFNYPHAVAVDINCVFVSQGTSRSIEVFRKDGSFIQTFNSSTFGCPYGMTTDDTSLFVADSSCNCIHILDKQSGQITLTFGRRGNNDGQLSFPSDVAVDRCYIYVADTHNHRIQIFHKSDGTFFKSFGTPGTSCDEAEFLFPESVAVDKEHIFVADTGNNRLQVFRKSDFSHVPDMSINGIPQISESQLCEPSGVCVDSDYIYISDSKNSRVQIFSKATATFFRMVGEKGFNVRQFRHTKHIAVDSDNIFVSDFFNNRIQVFNFFDPCRIIEQLN